MTNYLFSVKHFLIIVCLLGFCETNAQEAISASGGDAYGAGGSSSYTVGQVVYTANITDSGSVAQGVQQPFEISVVIGINELEIFLIDCYVFPNPTSNVLVLKILDNKLKNLTYNIYDVNGKLLKNNKIIENETLISLEEYVPTIYFLKVISSENKELKIFKIIKK